MSYFADKFNITTLAVIIMTVLFLLSIYFGISSGLNTAKAKSVYGTVVTLKQGLEFFFADQERFPSEEEFTDKNILLTYFSALPDNISRNSVCEENFLYKRLSGRSYEIDFCLAKATGGNIRGWNKISLQR